MGRADVAALILGPCGGITGWRGGHTLGFAGLYFFLLNGTWGQWKDQSVNHEQNFWKPLELLPFFFFTLISD